MLTKETMQQIFDEEKYRQEVKKTLDASSSPKQKSKTIEFLNSTFFLALLSSFLIPILINYYQSQSQKMKEKEAIARKISNERDEIKNRLDIISRLDTNGITGDEYVEIKNAFRGFDSTGGFSVSEEYAKRNIFSLISDYKYDLEYAEGRKETDSILARLPAIKDALHIAFNYLKNLYPFMYGSKEDAGVISVDKKEAMKNPSKIDIFTSGSKEMDSQLFSEVLPQLSRFQ
jgi:hypothetical protein